MLKAAIQLVPKGPNTDVSGVKITQVKPKRGKGYRVNPKYRTMSSAIMDINLIGNEADAVESGYIQVDEAV